MQKVPRRKIIKRTVKNIGKDVGNVLGKCLLKTSYPITGALPTKYQQCLANRFESYNPITATKISGSIQFLVGFPLYLYGAEALGSDMKIFNVNENLVQGITTMLLGVYSMVEGAVRTDYSHLKKEAIGCLFLKAPLTLFEYGYNYLCKRYKQAHIDLERDLFPPNTVQ